MRTFREGLIGRIGCQLFKLKGNDFAEAFSLFLGTQDKEGQKAKTLVGEFMLNANFQALQVQDHDDHLPTALKGPNYEFAHGSKVYKAIGKCPAFSNSPL